MSPMMSSMRRSPDGRCTSSAGWASPIVSFVFIVILSAPSPGPLAKQLLSPSLMVSLPERSWTFIVPHDRLTCVHEQLAHGASEVRPPAPAGLAATAQAEHHTKDPNADGVTSSNVMVVPVNFSIATP